MFLVIVNNADFEYILYLVDYNRQLCTVSRVFIFQCDRYVVIYDQYQSAFPDISDDGEYKLEFERKSEYVFDVYNVIC